MRYFSQSTLAHVLGEPFQWDRIPYYLRGSITDETRSFLRYIQYSDARIFIDWIEQDDSLMKLLCTEDEVVFLDRPHISKHALFSKFQSFVSPFLYPLLEKITLQNPFSESLGHFTFLEEKKRNAIETRIHEKIREHMFSAKYLPQQAWEDVFGQVVSTNTIRVYNLFSESAYSYRLDYVEKCCLLIQQDQCSAQMVAWIIQQTEKLHVHHQHRRQIDVTLSALYRNKLSKYRRQKKTKTSRLLYFIIGVLLLFSLVFFMIYLVNAE